MRTQSRPALGSGRMIAPGLMLLASARSTTSWMERTSGVLFIVGVSHRRATTAAARASQKMSILGWKRSGGRFLRVRRDFLFSESDIFRVGVKGEGGCSG